MPARYPPCTYPLNFSLVCSPVKNILPTGAWINQNCLKFLTCVCVCVYECIKNKKKVWCYLDILKKLIIRYHRVIAVATALKPVVPPPGDKDIGCVRNCGPKHVSENTHCFFQRLLVWLSFHALWLFVSQRHYQNIRARVRIFHVLRVESKQIELIIKSYYKIFFNGSICIQLIIIKLCEFYYWRHGPCRWLNTKGN